MVKSPDDFDDDVGHVLGGQFHESRLMNEPYSDAVKEWSKQRTEQSREETKQAQERTKQTTQDTVKSGISLVAFGGAVAVVAFGPAAAMWPAVVLGVAFLAPHALSTSLDRVRELIVATKSKPPEFPGPEPEKSLPDSKTKVVAVKRED